MTPSRTAPVVIWKKQDLGAPSASLSVKSAPPALARSRAPLLRQLSPLPSLDLQAAAAFAPPPPLPAARRLLPPRAAGVGRLRRRPGPPEGQDAGERGVPQVEAGVRIAGRAQGEPKRSVLVRRGELLALALCIGMGYQAPFLAAKNKKNKRILNQKKKTPRSGKSSLTGQCQRVL